MANCCFQNRITITAANNTFVAVGSLSGETSISLTQGDYFWIDLRNHFLDKLQDVVDGATMGMDVNGVITLHLETEGTESQDWGINWTDTPLRDLLGYTANLTGASSYIAPRRARASFYHDRPAVEFVSGSHWCGSSQTTSMAGITRSEIRGTKYQTAQWQLRFVKGSQEYVSTTGYCGTPYVGTGITPYFHAEHYWFNSEDSGSQGWNDGRPVRYYANASNTTIANTGATIVPSSGTYTEWVFKELDDWQEIASKEKAPSTIYYSLKFSGIEYKAS